MFGYAECKSNKQGSRARTNILLYK